MKSIFITLLLFLVIDTNTTAKYLSSNKITNQLQDDETYLEELSQKVKDAHQAEIDLIKQKKPSLPFLLKQEQKMISTPTQIKAANMVSMIHGLSESQIKVVENRLKIQKEQALNIKKYDEALLVSEASKKSKDYQNSIRNKIKADEQLLKVIALGFEFIKSSKEAQNYKVAGRLDMQKIFLAKSLYEMVNMQFLTYQTASTLAIEITDMANWEKNKLLNTNGQIVADQQSQLAKKVKSLVGTAKKFHERMIMEKNGPWMLIIGLLFGIGGVVGILYYIKKNIANQENVLFGDAASQAHRNDAFIAMSKRAGIQQNVLSTDTSTFDKTYEDSPFNMLSARNRQINSK